ncbi:hypothetical protein [Allokutzneria multivorans]|uniref:hypothetical protein n=1 Tax=Allokutzneria multivorans TaxID=1142134 RepID=UPI0031E64C8E
MGGAAAGLMPLPQTSLVNFALSCSPMAATLSMSGRASAVVPRNIAVARNPFE